MLEKNDATLKVTAGKLAVLQCESNTGVVMGVNPLAELNDFSLKTPRGIEITAAGKIGIAFVTVEGRGSVDIVHAFLPEQIEQDAAADALLIFGLNDDSVVRLNGRTLDDLAAVTVDGLAALIVPLKDKTPAAADVVERYRAAVGD